MPVMASAFLRSDHEAGIGNWRELGQPHTVGKLRQKPVRHGESEPRLADAAGAGQGDEPMRGGKAQDLAEIVVPGLIGRPSASSSRRCGNTTNRPNAMLADLSGAASIDS